MKQFRTLSSKRLPEWVSGLLLAAAVILAYGSALGNGFIWDDDSYVAQNLALHHLSGLGQIWFDATATPQYYPLIHTSFWIEYHLWGLNPLGFHVVNVLLHALAAVLLWRVLFFLKIPGAWFVAAIFALHPIQVESVAWVTERKNVLSGVFYFASVLAYLRFFECLDAGDATGRRRRFYWLAMVLFIAALLSKTVTCSLPATLLLVRWWKKGRLEKMDVVPLLPFFVMGLGFGLFTAWLENVNVGAHGAAWSLTFSQRLLIAGRAVWFYAYKLFWPASLAFTYPRWDIHAEVGWQWLFPLAATVVVLSLWLGRHRLGRGPLVAVLFFIVALAPALGFVNVYPFRYSFVADHFQYLAGIGLIVLVVAGLNRLPRAVPVVLLCVLGGLTWRQTHIYHDPETLWRDTLKKNPNCWPAHNNLGIELERQRKFDEAFEQYRLALPLAPDYPETYNNLGNAYFRKREYDTAMKNYLMAIRLDRNCAEAQNSAGVIYGMRANYRDAALCFRKALLARPAYARAHMNLGNVLRMQHDLDAAIREYDEALRLTPDDPAVHDNLGVALAQAGKKIEAAIEFNEALRLDPNDLQAERQLKGLR